MKKVNFPKAEIEISLWVRLIIVYTHLYCKSKVCLFLDLSNEFLKATGVASLQTNTVYILKHILCLLPSSKKASCFAQADSYFLFLYLLSGGMLLGYYSTQLWSLYRTPDLSAYDKWRENIPFPLNMSYNFAMYLPEKYKF